MSSLAIPTIGVHYSVPRLRAGWELSEETMPESVTRDEAVALLKAILAAWTARMGDMLVVRNFAIRWEQTSPSIGGRSRRGRPVSGAAS